MAHISFSHFLVHTCHECLKVFCIFIADGWFIVVVVVIFKYLREHIYNGLALRVTHCIDGSVDTFGHELMLQSVTLAVAHDDELYLPQPQIVQKLVAVVAYLAHD